MNLNVSTEFFDDVKTNFLQNNGEGIDSEIVDIVMRWKNMPVLDKICPRWSCQSHNEEVRNAEYEIIFVTQDDGSEILYKLYQELVQYLTSNYGILLLSASKYSIVTLCNKQFGAYPHINIQITSKGIDEYINISKEAWNYVLDKLEKGEL